MKKINLSALRHSAFYTPYLLAFTRDYLSQQGVEAEYTPAQNFQGLVESLLDKSVHIAQSAVGASLVSDTPVTAQIKHFAQINSRDGFFIVARNNEAFTWQSLIGKNVLIDHLFQPLAMFRYVLHKYRIDESKLNIMDAGSVENMIEVYRQGEGDFIHLQGPYAQQLEQDSQGKIVASIGKEVGPVAFSSLCCHQDFLDEDVVSRFYVAYQQAMRACQSEQAHSLADDVKHLFPEIDSGVLENTIADYQQLGTWSGTLIEEPHYQHAVVIFLASGDITSRVPYTSFVSGFE